MPNIIEGSSGKVVKKKKKKAKPTDVQSAHQQQAAARRLRIARAEARGPGVPYGPTGKPSRSRTITVDPSDPSRHPMMSDPTFRNLWQRFAASGDVEAQRELLSMLNQAQGRRPGELRSPQVQPRQSQLGQLPPTTAPGRQRRLMHDPGHPVAGGQRVSEHTPGVTEMYQQVFGEESTGGLMVPQPDTYREPQPRAAGGPVSGVPRPAVLPSEELTPEERSALRLHGEEATAMPSWVEAARSSPQLMGELITLISARRKIHRIKSAGAQYTHEREKERLAVGPKPPQGARVSPMTDYASQARQLEELGEVTLTKPTSPKRRGGKVKASAKRKPPPAKRRK